MQLNMNLVMAGDSYKYSHASQYPNNMVSMYDYMAARSDKVYKKVCFAGLQPYLEMLANGVTTADVEEANDFANKHGISFDRKGWDYIAEDLDGKFPIIIKAVPEGSIIPVGMPLVTVESTDKAVACNAGWVETLLLKVWYPTTIATKSYHVRKMLLKYGSPEWAQFAYHNFGDRGSSSVESAAIGGFAHLILFMGTDNFHALKLCNDVYNEPIAGYSVFASEHSTTTSHGINGEEQFVYDQLLDNPDAPIMSFVADSYDVYNFTNFCTKPDSRIRKLIESRPHQKLVLRPDSGEPIEVLTRILQIMVINKCFTPETDIEGKAYAKDFGILWGDGITPETIELILKTFTEAGYAAENFVFGSGGDIMQNVNRDILGFAIKCSSITVIPEKDCPNHTMDIDVFKDPITDPGKKSLKGKVTTYYNKATKTYFVDTIGRDSETIKEVLIPVFEEGKILKRYSMLEIRENSNALK